MNEKALIKKVKFPMFDSNRTRRKSSVSIRKTPYHTHNTHT